MVLISKRGLKQQKRIENRIRDFFLFFYSFFIFRGGIFLFINLFVIKNFIINKYFCIFFFINK